MKPLLSNFTIEAPRDVRQQIRAHVRTLILSGKLEPGERLPSTRELAKHWDTHVPTVHAALTTLVREGLLSRVNRVGTFVRQREQKLTCVGIYYSEDIWINGAVSYQQAVHAAIKQRLAELGIQTQVFVDPRPRSQQGTAQSELAKAAELRSIQALITTNTDGEHIAWHQKLPVPTAYATAAKLPNSVEFDVKMFAELSLRRLAEQKCRSIGLIAPFETSVADARSRPAPAFDFIDAFLSLAGKFEITIKNQWVYVESFRLSPTEGRAQEPFGYASFHHLWSQSQRPDGLVVFPDLASRGAVMAMLELQVAVPSDLRVVLHKDQEVPLLCPLPVSYVTSSAREAGDALVSQILKQTRGERCRKIKLPSRLMNEDQDVSNETAIST